MSDGQKMRPEDWVKRINKRWIVHQGLRQQAERWIGHLEEEDPERLRRSCRIVRRMCELKDEHEDPKPWFYSGLFSLATRDEAMEYLTPHRLTSAAVPALRREASVESWVESVGPETRELLERLRSGVGRCLEERTGESNSHRHQAGS